MIPVPHSLISSGNRAVVSYDTSAFLHRQRAYDAGGRAISAKASECSRRSRVIFWILVLTVLVSVVLLSAVAAHADPASMTGHATLIQFSGKTTLGKPQVQVLQVDRISSYLVTRLKMLETLRRRARERVTDPAPHFLTAHKQ